MEQQVDFNYKFSVCTIKINVINAIKLIHNNAGRVNSEVYILFNRGASILIFLLLFLDISSLFLSI